jgi:hypothetical protein
MEPAELAPSRVAVRAIPQRTAQAVSGPRRPAIEALRPRIIPTSVIRIGEEKR